MDGSEHDERRRRLQRIAYGADASPEERAAAEAELLELADVAAHAGEAAAASDGVHEYAAPDAPRDDADARPARAPSSTWRSTIAVGVIALVIGLAVGTGTAGLARVDVPAPGAGGTAGSDDSDRVPVIARSGTPVEHTPVYEVFDREQRPSDGIPADLLAGTALEPTSPRLLVTRSDGVAAYAALTLDGDLCVVMVVDAVGGGSACTDQGVMPPEGLTATFGFDDRAAITVSLHADGTAGLSPAEQPAE